MEVLVFFGIMMGLALLTYVVMEICFKVSEYRHYKKQAQHPQFYAWIAEFGELISQRAKYRNQNIVPLKRLVDDILKEWEYYDEEMRFRKGADLELYRMNIQRHQRVLDNMEAEEKRLREVIRKYNAEHHLEEDNW